ncbi:MAG TPA: DUF4230 domain-containing protein [Sphingobacterium sp.]|nr:DUF4230 domain-containing protein [Sphingobacterium sp.]
MKKSITVIIIILILGGVFYYFYLTKGTPEPKQQTSHQFLLERVESLGKLELVKYRVSDIIEHKNKTAYLPDASVILIIKADAVGCIDLKDISPQNIDVVGDSVSIILPAPEICYIKIDHKDSKVYDTKMAFFREADLVDEAYKLAEEEIKKEVDQSDMMQQTRKNGKEVVGALLEGLGFKKIHLSFENE